MVGNRRAAGDPRRGSPGARDERTSSALRPYKAASLPPLSASEERQLFSKLRAGDTSVRDRIVRANFGLAISSARPYRSIGMPMEDILQEAMSGLVRSVATYDPTLGYRFSTYAVRVIRTTIMRALDAQLRTIRLPSSFVHARWQMSLKKSELTGQLHRAPTDEELALAMDASISKIARLRSIRDETLPLYPEGMAREAAYSHHAISYNDIPADDAIDPLRALVYEDSYAQALKTLRSEDVV